MVTRIALFILIVLMAVPVWSQDDATATGAPAASTSDDLRMTIPPPVSAESYPTVTGSEVRSNYLRAGVTVSSTYSDNLLGGVSPSLVGDESYSIAPYIALDETTSRLHSVLNFDPGFTFYQHTSYRNEADENGGLNVAYRMSPHVIFSIVDTFRKSSNFLNQPNGIGDPVFGSGQVSPVTVIPPIADQLSNTGTAQVTYQFGPNAMVGISGIFTNLHYSNAAEVPGLYDSGSRSGSVFYTHRLSGKHYVGTTYQYQMLLAYPTGFRAQTQTNSLMLFYSIYLKPTFAISFFGGPQYSDTEESVLPRVRAWSPATGTSLFWQARETNFAISYSHVIAPAGGLVGAVHQDAAILSIQRKLTRMITGNLQGSYANNKLLYSALSPASINSGIGGHQVSGKVSIQRRVGERFLLGVAYSRIHQSYSNIAAIERAPDTNQGSVFFTYQFSRPLGR